MLKELIHGAGTTASTGDKSSYDSKMQQLLELFAGLIARNEQAWQYGAKYDTLQKSDLDYVIPKDSGYTNGDGGGSADGHAYEAASIVREKLYDFYGNPAGVDTAVEEILRFNSPQTSWRRVATEDTEIAGYKIPAGTQVFLSLGSANHDEAVYEDPERFDIRRKNARTNIAFGRGIHFCLGNRLAILEATIALETLTAKIPSLDMVKDQTFSFFPNFTFRGPTELWLRWDG